MTYYVGYDLPKTMYVKKHVEITHLQHFGTNEQFGLFG